MYTEKQFRQDSVPSEVPGLHWENQNIFLLDGARLCVTVLAHSILIFRAKTTELDFLKFPNSLVTKWTNSWWEDEGISQ